MNELSENDPEYKRVLSSYYDLVETSILRTKTKEFIGGLPITLLRRHLFNLLEKSRILKGVSKYTVTSKVDGTRLFMFINEKDPNNPDFRKVHFIDRSLKIYTLSNKEKHSLNSIRGPKMLLDGELVFFKNNKSHYFLSSSATDYLSFMVFDIIYGPTSVQVETSPFDSVPLYGSANAMAGPVGGSKWPYAKRLNIAQNLIVPTQENGRKPPLSLAFCESPFFRIEMKSIINISDIPSTVTDIVDFINKDFKTSRGKYYDFLNEYCDSKALNDKFKKSELEFDGLIFTPLDTEYVTGNWNKFRNTQYKWKPLKEQTIDFYVKDTGNKTRIKGQVKEFKIVELYILSRGNLQLFDFKDKNTGLIDSKFMVNDGSIAEFGYSNKYDSFVFNRLRLDKDRPNAWRTAETVKESILYPVDINFLPNLYRGEDIIKTAGQYLPGKALNRLLLCSGSLKILPISRIQEQLQFKTDNKDVEIEIRLGKIRGKYFNAGVKYDTFINTIKFCDDNNWRHKIVNYIDATSGNIRTRYQYIPEIKQLVKLNSISKESVSKIDISLNTVADFDIRFSNAKEELSDQTITFPDATRITEKKRISYYDPNGVIQVDLTEVNLSELKDSSITRIGASEFQIEFEILKNDINAIEQFLQYFISEVETIWD